MHVSEVQSEKITKSSAAYYKLDKDLQYKMQHP